MKAAYELICNLIENNEGCTKEQINEVRRLLPDNSKISTVFALQQFRIVFTTTATLHMRALNAQKLELMVCSLRLAAAMDSMEKKNEQPSSA